MSLLSRWASARKMFVMPIAAPGLCLAVLVCPSWALAFENAKVMPKGVSRLNLRVVNTTINDKTDGGGSAQDLAQPLAKQLQFKDVLKGEQDELKRELTAGFLLANGISESASLGSFEADLAGRVTVYAPIFSFGITDRLTIAATLPVYDASVNANLGFRPGQGSTAFRDTLVAGYNNQAEGARDFVSRINDATNRLGNKLVENGYQRIEPWRETALGDAQVLAKYAVLKDAPVNVALTGGAVVPTGRIDDPDNLIDIGFGDGQWDGFFQVSADQPVAQSGFYFNQYARYTVQFEDEQTLRLKTAEETIEVAKSKVGRDLGDKLNGGAALLFEGDTGLTSGVGYNFYQKSKDVFRTGDAAAKAELERNTFQRSHEAELAIGYSGVPAFRRGQIPAPFEVGLTYKRQLASENMPVTHFFQLETGVFF
jgi:hypothetical protein